MASTKITLFIQKTQLILSSNYQQTMSGKIIGLGGVFIKSPNKDALIKWYEEKLGIKMEDWGTSLSIRSIEKEENQVFSVMPDTTKYLPETKSYMINWMVENMDEFIEIIKSKGVEILHHEASEYGKFAHILDIDGNKLELWEPPKSSNS